MKKLTAAQIEQLLAFRNGFREYDDLDADIREYLFCHFCDSGEMPYGTAKARDGDPDEWIINTVTNMSLGEFNQLVAA